MKRKGLLLSLLPADSGTLAVLDKAVLGLWEDAAHLDEALDGDNVEIDLEQADLESPGIKLVDGGTCGLLSRRAKHEDI